MDLYNLSMGIGSFMMQAWKALVIFMLKWLVSNKGTVFQRKLFQLEMEASDSVSWLHSKSEQFTSASTWEAITFKQPVVPWWRLVLSTYDRIALWGYKGVGLCVFCRNFMESRVICFSIALFLEEFGYRFWIGVSLSNLFTAGVR